MARFVINKKVYDTEKMTLIGNVKKWYKFQGWIQQQIFGKDAGHIEDCEMFRSNKGNYLLVHKKDSDTFVGEAITEEEAKGLLMSYDYDSYAEIFGELEEA